MNERIVIAPVRKTIRVNAPIAHAFEVFTSGLTRWWPHNHGVGKKPIQKVMMEPPHRLVMVWQVNAQWKPDIAMKSEVDVRFAADGPNATDVELLHHKFETMGAEAGASMRKDVDGGWPGLIERFVQEAERSKG